MKKAFTMVELIFIIVIIGILSAVALPKFSMTRDDALIAKNTEYIVGIMEEISSYIMAHGNSTDDLTEMSNILVTLKDKKRVTIDMLNKNVNIKIGQEENCITVDINSSGSSELLQTIFSNISSDRVCYQVQELIKEKDYPLVVRGRLITF